MGRCPEGKGQGVTINPDHYPNIDVYLHRPLLSDPPLCTLKELQDGTYSIEDLAMIHEILDLKMMLLKPKA